jgi:hypothetical protein
MPVKRLVPKHTPQFDQLVDQLTAEWSSPTQSAAAPVILEETDASGNVVHVYVVWDEWAHLDRTVRGEAIMEAAKRVKSSSEVLDITIALGVTPEEADRFQLQWR